MIPTMLIIQQWRAINGMILANPDVPLVKIESCWNVPNPRTDFSTVVAGVTT